MDLSIIIVNYNSKDYLRKCIASILSNTHGLEFEIIVIDSASFDGCRAMLQQQYPQVRFIQCDKNIGFAKANNEAFKVSIGRFLLFLNPDTDVEGSAIRVSMSELSALPNAGIAGAKLLNTDRSIQISCIRRFPNILNQFLDAEVLQRLFSRSRLWGAAPLFDRSIYPVEVEAVSGAYLMMKRTVFENVGMFSTEFFMYSEDIDLCYKARHEGWKTYYVPSAVVVHHGGGSSSKSNIKMFSSLMMIESRLRFFRKTRANWYCSLFRVSIFFAGTIRVGAIISIWPLLVICGKGSVIDSSLKKWVAILRWSVGKNNGSITTKF